MNSISVEAVYQKNDRVNERLHTLIRSLDRGEIDRIPEDGKWTIANIVEHIAIVDTSMTRVCAKLLRKAEGDSKPGDGCITSSDVFAEKTVEIANLKMEAPDMVQPSGERSIEESLELINGNRQRLEELKPSFEKFDSNEYRFPHPFLGDLSAGEWLMLIGGHKARHIKQIERQVGRK